VFPHDYQTDVREYLQRYRSEVESLANARSSLEKLRKHRTQRTYPPALNSIKTPSIQFSRTFLNAPSEDRIRGSYSTPAGAPGTFSDVVAAQVTWVKAQVLRCVCGGHLSLTRPLLESLLVGLVQAGWEEVGRDKKKKEKGKKGKAATTGKQKAKKAKPPKPRRPRTRKAKARPEVPLRSQSSRATRRRVARSKCAFGLCFGTDSASACSVSVYGLSDFFSLYDLDWTFLVPHVVSSVCPSPPPLLLTLACVVS
jgi:hypothetical protein